MGGRSKGKNQPSNHRAKKMKPGMMLSTQISLLNFLHLLKGECSCCLLLCEGYWRGGIVEGYLSLDGYVGKVRPFSENEFKGYRS